MAREPLFSALILPFWTVFLSFFLLLNRRIVLLRCSFKFYIHIFPSQTDTSGCALPDRPTQSSHRIQWHSSAHAFLFLSLCVCFCLSVCVYVASWERGKRRSHPLPGRPLARRPSDWLIKPSKVWTWAIHHWGGEMTAFSFNSTHTHTHTHIPKWNIPFFFPPLLHFFDTQKRKK